MRKRRVKSYRGKDDLQDMIEELRLQYGLYLRDIAKYMKVSLTTVKNWASARTSISQEHIEELNGLYDRLWTGEKQDRDTSLEMLELPLEPEEVEVWS